MACLKQTHQNRPGDAKVSQVAGEHHAAPSSHAAAATHLGPGLLLGLEPSMASAWEGRGGEGWGRGGGGGG
jgi:hypothetical protein